MGQEHFQTILVCKHDYITDSCDISKNRCLKCGFVCNGEKRRNNTMWKEHFQAFTTEERIRIEKDLYKIWNNWMIEADYHLFATYGVTNGKELVQYFMMELLIKGGYDEGKTKDLEKWEFPF